MYEHVSSVNFFPQPDMRGMDNVVYNSTGFLFLEFSQTKQNLHQKHENKELRLFHINIHPNFHWIEVKCKQS